MFLHFGKSPPILKKEIIGIFDADTATVSRITKKYLSAAEKQNSVYFPDGDIPKSFILYRERYREGERYQICFSSLSASVLRARTEKQTF